MSYLIQSTASRMRKRPPVRIRQHLAETESYQDPAAAGVWPEGDRRASIRCLWRPVALVILAGMASFALGQRFAGRSTIPPPAPRFARDAASAIGRPLMTEPAAGLPRHRLYYHLREHAWCLDTDAERRRTVRNSTTVPAAGAGW